MTYRAAIAAKNNILGMRKGKRSELSLVVLPVAHSATTHNTASRKSHVKGFSILTHCITQGEKLVALCPPRSHLMPEHSF